MLNEPAANLPRIPHWRRAIAFVIDFVVGWLISSLLGLNPLAQASLFMVAWLGLRAVFASRNHGQSLGRWAVDTRVRDAKRGKTPGLQALLKREGVTGLGAVVILLGLNSLRPGGTGWGLVTIVPLIADYGVALADPLRRQAFHDRLARTIVAPSTRGYSLDIKAKRLLAKLTRRMKQ